MQTEIAVNLFFLSFFFMDEWTDDKNEQISLGMRFPPWSSLSETLFLWTIYSVYAFFY